MMTRKTGCPGVGEGGFGDGVGPNQCNHTIKYFVSAFTKLNDYYFFIVLIKFANW